MSRVTVVGLDPDAKRTNVVSGSITLSATPNTVTTIVVPVSAKGFRLYPNAAIIRWGISGSPLAVTDVGTADQDAVASDEYLGGYAMPAMWETRLLEEYHATSNASRTISVMSATASATLYFEFF